MDRIYHKKDVLYNTDSVDNIIGMGSGNYIYDKIDVFIERINKKNGFVVITYTDYVDNKPVERQFMPYTENERDIEEIIKTNPTREMKVHFVDYSNLYFYEHDKFSERNHMDIKYTEYIDGKPVMNSIRVLRSFKDYIESKIYEYRKTDPRVSRPFDGYSRDPIPERTRPTRRERRQNAFPMPEPSITSLWIKDIKGLANYIKDYILMKIGLGQNNYEIEMDETIISQRAR